MNTNVEKNERPVLRNQDKTKTFKTIACIAALISSLAAAHSQGNAWTNEIPVGQARAHVHERAAVFGRVYHVSSDSNVYFDFGGFYSEAVFTAVLPNANQLASQFVQLEGKEIVVLGRITTNSFGIPQIRVKSVDNIFMVGPDNHVAPLDFNPEPPTRHINSVPKEDTTSWLSVFAADPDETNTIVTLTGKTYQNSKVIQLEPDGITIKYAPNGFGLSEIKLTFDDLPLNLQQMYGFDPQIAAAYINEQKSAADLSDAEKRRREWRARHDELTARAAVVQHLYEQKRRAYEDEENDYDAKIRLGAWHDTERLAETRELQAREAEYQSAVRQQQLIQQQQQLILMQQTNRSNECAVWRDALPQKTKLENCRRHCGFSITDTRQCFSDSV
jgi:hypothetical protein